MIYNVDNLPVRISVGRVGENEFCTIGFRVDSWLAAHPGSSVYVVWRRPDGLTYDAASGTSSPLLWSPDSAALSVAGSGKLEIRLVKDGVVGKSATVVGTVEESLEATGDPPDPPVPDYFQQAITAAPIAVAAQGAAVAAQGKAEAAQADAESAKTDAQTAAQTAAQKASDAAGAAGAAVAAHNTDPDAHAEKMALKEAVANKVTALSPASTDAQYPSAKCVYDSINTHHYQSIWNKATSQMTRGGDASGFPTATTNFGHFGAVNPSKLNPFDHIYPWSGRRLCNIDIGAYMALAAGADITDCVTAWEGDVDFSFTHANGVWVYTPEFWGRAWDEGDDRIYDVCDKAVAGYIHYPAGISGRWFGRAVTMTVGGTAKTVLLPVPGMPGKNIAMSTLHQYAKNYGATLNNIYSIDATSLLYLVEYANFNSQTAIGNGVHDLYRQSGYHIKAAASGSVVKIGVSDAGPYCIAGAIMDIGTTDGGAQVGSYIVSSAVTDGTDSTLLDVTLVGDDGTTPASATVTTAHYWSVHGLANVADSGIGSDSGYLGANGRCNAYYRGEVMHSNLYQYVLGAYRQTGTNHVWIAASPAAADAADGLDTSTHIDTGLALPSGDAGATYGGYVGALGMCPGLCAPAFCTAGGGSSSNPVGDYVYVPTMATVNTVMVLGGGANNGTCDGRWFGSWNSAAGDSYWSYAALPALKAPLRGLSGGRIPLT